MDKLVELAKVLRSKNSGPFSITLDILFKDYPGYKRVVDSNKITVKSVAELYRLDEKDITELVFFDKGLGIKITFNRRISSGTAGDRDVYGAQQHAPLFDILIP
ncbi:DUF4387 domain-containing protein [Clostridium polynesiense]|uniref:DUF4387 domain-containing protein n=1 Tax=Clostridium polynesiense TaxID=1325933 RepID=UPI00058F6915|nr:DUF4387 domain-containing protein [Clostridium polynesiense]